jgi:hypothetical protein
MTGITDVIKNARMFYSHSRYRLKALLRTFSDDTSQWLESLLLGDSIDEEVLGKIPIPRLEFFQEKCAFVEELKDSQCRKEVAIVSAIKSDYEWGLLLPICYRGEVVDDCWERLSQFSKSLKQTTSTEDRERLHIYVGIDQHDQLYDNDEARVKIAELFNTDGHQLRVDFISLRSSFRGKLCLIWDALAQQSVRDGCDFFVFLGDDVYFEAPSWKTEIEGQFLETSLSKGLTFGFGSVCFRDTAFKVFPTFPVMHKRHLEIFGGSLFPRGFINQHGDPYLFELYRRWGASRFAPTATVCNTVGGAHEARYEKEGSVWCDEVLSQSITTVERWLSCHSIDAPRIMCVNIVVPSYRCDMSILRGITSLQADSSRVSVSALIVVDNPSAPNLAEVQELEEWTPNHLVRVWI